MPANDEEETFRVWAIDNTVYGPIDLATLIQWVQENRVLAETWVHVHGDNVWRQAQEIDALQGCFGVEQRAGETKRPPGGSGNVRVEELRQFTVFAGLSNAQLEQLARFGEVRLTLPGELVLHKGDPGDALFFVLLGQVRVRLVIGLEDQTLCTIPAGEFFGEMAMFNEAPRSADVVAETETRLWRLSAQACRLLVKEIPELASPVLFAIARTMAGRIAESNRRFQREVTSTFLWH